jgi:hypothetical protein
MIELLLALLIVAVALYVIYRLATDPAVEMTPVSGDLTAATQSLESADLPESNIAAAAKQDGSPEAEGTTPFE